MAPPRGHSKIFDYLYKPTCQYALWGLLAFLFFFVEETFEARMLFSDQFKASRSKYVTPESEEPALTTEPTLAMDLPTVELQDAPAPHALVPPPAETHARFFSPTELEASPTAAPAPAPTEEVVDEGSGRDKGLDKETKALMKADIKELGFPRPHIQRNGRHIGFRKRSAAAVRERWKKETAGQSKLEQAQAAEKERVAAGGDFLYESAGQVGHLVGSRDVEAAGQLELVLETVSYRNEIILLATDLSQIHFAVNMVANLRRLKLDHFVVLVVEPSTCDALNEEVPRVTCVHSTLFETNSAFHEHVAGGKANAFVLWTVRKRLIGQMLNLGVNVFQSDTDVMWNANPYPILKTTMKDMNMITQAEGAECPRANGGVIYFQNTRRGGPVWWALQELEARVQERNENPQLLNEIYPGLASGDAHTDVGIATATTDEQDMLNDVLETAFENRTVTWRTIWISIKDEEARKRWLKEWAPKHPEWVNDPAPTTPPAPLCAAHKIVSASKHLRHHPMYGMGMESAGAPEQGCTAFDWLFSGYHFTFNFMRECAVPPEAPDPPALQGPGPWPEVKAPMLFVSHMAGVKMPTRQMAMGAYGQWHYQQADARRKHFPMDRSRLLALAEVPSTGLDFGNVEKGEALGQYITVVRRLMALAGASGRTAVLPLVACKHVMSEVHGEELAEPGMLRLPCPYGKGYCCLPRLQADCERPMLVAPPEFDFFRSFLRGPELMQANLSDLRPAQAASDQGWDADKWKGWSANAEALSRGPAPELRARAVEHGSVLETLRGGPEAAVVFLQPALPPDQPSGTALLDSLPAYITALSDEFLQEVEKLSCSLDLNAMFPDVPVMKGLSRERRKAAETAMEMEPWLQGRLPPPSSAALPPAAAPQPQQAPSPTAAPLTPAAEASGPPSSPPVGAGEAPMEEAAQEATEAPTVPPTPSPTPRPFLTSNIADTEEEVWGSEVWSSMQEEWAEAELPNPKQWRSILTRAQQLRSVVHRGTQRRMDKVWAKLLLEEPITVLVLGGSITAAADSWASLLFRHIEEAFPPREGRHHMVNAAVPATGPQFMYACLESRISEDAKNSADLVLLEYGNNAGPQWTAQPSQATELHGYERLIRKLLRLPSQPAVMTVTFSSVLSRKGSDSEDFQNYEGKAPTMLTPYFHGAHDFQELTARYYDLPIVSVRDAMWADLRKSNMVERNEALMAEGSPSRVSLTEICGEVEEGCLHPHKPLGVQVMGDVVIGYVRAGMSHLRMVLRLRAAGRSGSETAALRALAQGPLIAAKVEVDQECGLLQSGLYLPAPMTIGNLEDGCWKNKCFNTEELRGMLVRGASQGFRYSNEEFSRYAGVLKPGFIAQQPGERLVLQVDTSQKFDLEASAEQRYYVNYREGEAPNEEQALVTLAVLVSYEKMGIAEISCVKNCECDTVTYNAHQDITHEKKSVTELFAIAATRHKECQIQVLVIDETTSNMHKFKVSALAVDADVRSFASGTQNKDNLGDGSHLSFARLDVMDPNGSPA